MIELLRVFLETFLVLTVLSAVGGVMVWLWHKLADPRIGD